MGFGSCVSSLRKTLHQGYPGLEGVLPGTRYVARGLGGYPVLHLHPTLLSPKLQNAVASRLSGEPSLLQALKMT